MLRILFDNGTLSLIFLILVGMILNFIAGSDCVAVTYYVSELGDDLNVGTDRGTRAWRTLQHAVDTVAPGDIIIVEDGTYPGCRIENSGTAIDWMTLKADAGASVLIDSPGPGNRHGSNIEIETWSGDGTVSYWIVEGFEVANAPGWGIDLRGNDVNLSHHLTVRKNKVHHSGGSSRRTGIFTAFVDHVLIEWNESYANSEHGIYHSNSGDYPVIRGNICHDNYGCGIHMNGDLSMGNDGIISHGTIENNIIYENGTPLGGAGINLDGVTDSIFRNNLLYGNHAGGFAIFQGDGAVCSQNNRVLNNTIVMATDGRWCINIPDPGGINNKIFNNILYTYHSWRGCIVIPSPTLSGFESDYNVVMDRFSADGDSSVISLIDWQAYGFDTHSFIAIPDDLFIDYTTDDYHLKNTSPAIDSGASLPDVPYDLEGISRPQGLAFDQGAYEFFIPTIPFTITGSIALMVLLISFIFMWKFFASG